MKFALCFVMVFVVVKASAAWAVETRHMLENKHLSRTLTVKDGRLLSSELQNKRAAQAMAPKGDSEFRIRISQGTHLDGTDIVLTSADFVCVDVKEYAPRASVRAIVFTLQNAQHGLTVGVHYQISDDDFYMHKFLSITSAKPVTLERIDVETIGLEDAVQPCKHNQITTRLKSGWRPGLGQPLYTSKTGTFWGIEFPAAQNYVEDNAIFCGYLWGREIVPGSTYWTYPAVFGVADEPQFVADTFLEYIDRIRIRPWRLQVQYNSWFDFKREVTREKFADSVKTIHAELVEKRGVPPLTVYVVDDGWQILEPGGHDITKKTWPVNEKFDAELKDTLALLRERKSGLGLWFSPACMFGANHMARTYEQAGFETIGLKAKQMSMSGPKYTALLEDRLLELTRQGVTFFKFDGIFGHVNLRMFELTGRGSPAMPQLIPSDFSADDIRLNSPQYDEAKIYYLVAGTERLMQIFRKMHEVNPQIYLTLSNGAYLSPWWLQYGDAVWMINAGDEGGSGTSGLLAYRDGGYYEIWKKEGVQFPMSSLFNHEPKQKVTAEDPEDLRRYVLASLARGSGLVEIYLRVRNLRESDWNVWADGLKWAHRFAPVFRNVRMHGGDPAAQQVYGYAAWNRDMGYVSLHNPADREQTYRVTLNRELGVPADAAYKVGTSLKGSLEGLAPTYRSGDAIDIVLKPFEVRVIEFTRE